MFSGVIRAFLNASRRQKQVVLILSDLVMLFSACWMALSLRLGEIWLPITQYWIPCLLVPLISVPVMAKMGLYRAVIRYMSHTTLWVSVKAVTISVLIWTAVIMLLQVQVPVPRSVLFIYWFTAVPLVAGSRLYARWLIRHWLSAGRRRYAEAPAVVLFGAGSAGTQLASALSHSVEMSPVAFIDDDPQKQGTEIAGLRVYALDALPDLIERYGVESVLLSISSLSRSERRIMVERIDAYPVSVKVVPGVAELASGEIDVSDIRDVDVVDLLGRDAVEPNEALLSACIGGQVVMVTGAGGSIGSELCRQIIRLQPRALVLFELSEYGLYAIEGELRTQAEALGVQLLPVLGSVQDQAHLEQVMRHYGVNTVYHAAAYKHVPIVEFNMAAGLRNNVLGTLRTAEAAIASGVRNFVLISTDKAVRPTNVMGASKRLAEMVLQALSEREQHAGHPIRFAMVRFGNVLGSSGSVIPLFRRQIEAGGPVTVTHPEITRYFMTIPEAAALVIQAGSMGNSGDVFVLDMGKPVKIVDLAREMIRLAGLRVRDETCPDGDIEIHFTGLRPGEKLYEELLIGGDVKGTDHPMIMRASEEMLSWQQLVPVLEQLEHCTGRWQHEKMRELLLSTVNGYRPESEIVDLLCKEESVDSLVEKAV
ncbi:polysaccharide biosynthesis protein [Marinobacterium sediminicola]|uniref:NDP-sugar epimerase, includes UDP-GlcNAc-inverting 4,6-dehydratase FlaA1 and capsular polysaccharide biosynthesis protein EpsC n=1 Tax=Marinobacterium sediminicola TaxID=518898 RepID=A0ABY1S125_9GAMM|nr:nucleoside-diphosphate sugar epimerase/dehydratase [Marinobacterium sediminicola]ULG68378.1 polysaccharide biosynthesis protein [Marinobacterium sediminicola]SMR74743.1 NDP-sugar epimerase, includes UDP-GlcNAc-inverting 4,6-dehydratase FlaA1 and capsular polysaccharide biosynthesis protein EpsC [Marinobacterium sediminicola]